MKQTNKQTLSPHTQLIEAHLIHKNHVYHNDKRKNTERLTANH